MRLATWNVNSLKARLPRVLQFLDEHRPDVLCLQETKCQASAFPHVELQRAGYHAVEHSAGRWAGVAILVPRSVALTGVTRGLTGEALSGEARWIEASVGERRLASAYVPNGRSVDSPSFAEKLAFLEAMARRAPALDGLMGDLNVTREDRDVYDPAAFTGSTHVTPAERSRLEAVLAAGLTDAYRVLHPEQPQFTWWDYRQGHFHRDLGLRIDYVLLGDALCAELSACAIDRTYRKGPKPSDHAPLIAQC